MSVRCQYEQTEDSRVKTRLSVVVTYDIKNALIRTSSSISTGRSFNVYRNNISSLLASEDNG